MNKFSAAPLVYLITKGEATCENFSEKSVEILQVIKVAVEAKISFIQIREKRLPARLVFELTEKAAKLTRKSQTKLLVNDRADIAFLAKADGVQLTSLSLSAATIRRTFPKDFLVGVSTHTLAEAEKAKRQGADFVTFSPIFFTPDKGESKGLDALHEVCEKLKPFPVVALGGIDEMNYREALQIADGFAAIRFLNDLENLRKVIGNKC